MPQSNANAWGVFGVLALAALLYAAGYVQFLSPLEMYRSVGETECLHVPHFRGPFAVTSVVFQPAHQCDRCLRPRYWEWQSVKAPAAINAALNGLAAHPRACMNIAGDAKGEAACAYLPARK